MFRCWILRRVCVGMRKCGCETGSVEWIVRLG